MDAAEKPGMRGQESDATPTSYRRIQDLIREDIVAGRLPQNAHLKTADLAARYGVSALVTSAADDETNVSSVEGKIPSPTCRVRQPRW